MLAETGSLKPAGGALQGSATRSWEVLHDVPLVGLADLTLLEQRLSQAVLRSGPMVAILFANVNQMPTFDITYGLRVGDQLLRAVAGRLVGLVDRDDSVAYLGENQFIVLCETLDSTSAVEALTARVNVGLEGVYALEDVKVSLNPTVGISFAGRGENIPEHMRNVTATVIRDESPKRLIPSPA